MEGHLGRGQRGLAFGREQAEEDGGGGGGNGGDTARAKGDGGVEKQRENGRRGRSAGRGHEVQPRSVSEQRGGARAMAGEHALDSAGASVAAGWPPSQTNSSPSSEPHDVGTAQHEWTAKDSLVIDEDSEDEEDNDDDEERPLLIHRVPPQSKESLESLDYDTWDSTAHARQFLSQSKKQRAHAKKRENVLQWVLFFCIGIATAVVAFFIDFVVHKLMNWKFSTLVDSVNHCKDHGCLALSLVYFILFNSGFVLIATGLTALAPVATGSGIPEIKCYLNGIKIPGVTDLKTMVAKVVGVLFSVSGGMFVGKEGPMIHSGAIIGAGLTQGKSSNLPFITTGFSLFRNDRAKRDFVSGGAAAGVAAAFGAPLGGVLFSLEEGSSFWNQSLTWRTLFCSMSSAFMLNVLASGINLHKWGQLEAPSLVNFGRFNDDIAHLWNVVDLGVFVLMGIVGGLCGALFNDINRRITLYRMKQVKTSGQKMAEAILINVVATVVVFVFSLTLGECKQLTKEDQQEEFAASARSFFCNEGEYNDMATLAFNPQEIAIKTMFHLDGKFSLLTLTCYFALFFFVACWTYGVAIPSGLFVPCLVTGAAFGRLTGSLFRDAFPGYTSTALGTYALIGAAAFLGGVVRMTISLTVILIESTDEITLGLPLMVTLMVAKWVGDYFNEGLYDIHIELKHIPLLGWEPSEEMKRFQASDIMSRSPVCLYRVERVRDVVAILSSNEHNGFPIVQDFADTASHADAAQARRGKFRGLILRSHIITLLQERCFGPRRAATVLARQLTPEDFVKHYPLHISIFDIMVDLSDEDLDMHMDFGSYMLECPYTAWKETKVARVFNLFRTMGLRHLVVLDRDNAEVVGIVTRKNLAHLSEHDGRPAESTSPASHELAQL